VSLKYDKFKKEKDKVLLEHYHDPENPGSYGGIEPFAKDNEISLKRTKQILEKGLGYALLKPRRRKFPTLHVKLF